jgi:hypothetical protein
MTAGLLVSRKTKNDLYNLQLSNNTPDNVNRYKLYKQNYFKLCELQKNFTLSKNCKPIQKILKKLGKRLMRPWVKQNLIKMLAKLILMALFRPSQRKLQITLILFSQISARTSPILSHQFKSSLKITFNMITFSKS